MSIARNGDRTGDKATDNVMAVAVTQMKQEWTEC